MVDKIFRMTNSFRFRSWMQSAERRFACKFRIWLHHVLYVKAWMSPTSHPPTTTIPRMYGTPYYIHHTNLTCYHITFRSRKDTILPLSTPITGIDGRVMHEIIVPKDTNVTVSILNCNRDPALWGPDSYEWKPERWLSPLPDTVKQAPIPGVYSNL